MRVGHHNCHRDAPGQHLIGDVLGDINNIEASTIGASHQTNRLRIPQLRQLPDQSPPLRRKTQLSPTHHHRSPLKSDDPEKAYARTDPLERHRKLMEQ